MENTATTAESFPRARTGYAHSSETRARILEAALAEACLEEFQNRVRADVERGSMRPMSDAEIRAHGYFLFGGHQFLDRLLEAKPYPGDKAVAQAYLGLLRRGLGTETPSTKTTQTPNAGEERR